MGTNTLYRLAGLSLLVGAVATIVVNLLPVSNMADARVAVRSAAYYPATIILLVSGLLVALGLVGLYLRQREESGVLGLVAMVSMFMATTLATAGFGLLQVVIFPWVARLPLSHSQVTNGPAAIGLFFIVATLVLTVGTILFAVSSLRAKVYRRWVSIAAIVLVVLGIPLSGLNLPGVLGQSGELVYMLALGLYGFELVRSSVPAIVTTPKPQAFDAA